MPQLIVSDTNAMVAGFPVPPGAYEFPLHGDLEVRTSGGGISNATVGTMDTLLVYREGFSVQAGPDILVWFSLGCGVIMLGLGTLAFARWLARKLTGLGDVGEI